uniref:Uncharacterized protein n=1 Tax=Arundo donax TaxID=35708 RepID=A0A0A9DA30_ARUDO
MVDEFSEVFKLVTLEVYNHSLLYVPTAQPMICPRQNNLNCLCHCCVPICNH